MSWRILVSPFRFIHLDISKLSKFVLLGLRSAVVKRETNLSLVVRCLSQSVRVNRGESEHLAGLIQYFRRGCQGGKGLGNPLLLRPLLPLFSPPGNLFVGLRWT